MTIIQRLPRLWRLLADVQLKFVLSKVKNVQELKQILTQTEDDFQKTEEILSKLKRISDIEEDISYGKFQANWLKTLLYEWEPEIERIMAEIRAVVVEILTKK